MHAVSTNQIADIFHFNNNMNRLTLYSRKYLSLSDRFVRTLLGERSLKDEFLIGFACHSKMQLHLL